jgi:hypothetical protein
MKTRRGVQICRVGTYPLSTGMHKFTRAQFASAVRNAAGRQAPRIGIGHTDPRWAQIDASKDGEPALGRVENLRLEEDGDVLVGDYVSMPDWFADSLHSAFPGRSIEGSCDGDDLILTAVKVLGTKMPGIHTLADLEEFVSEEGPVLVAAGADNDGREITVVFGSRDANPSQPEVTKMTKREKVCRALGLPSDASDEQLREKGEQAGLIETPPRATTREKVCELFGLPADASNAQVRAKAEAAGVIGNTARPARTVKAAATPAGSIGEEELLRRTRVRLRLEPAAAPVAASVNEPAREAAQRRLASASSALFASPPAGAGAPATSPNPLGVATQVAAGRSAPDWNPLQPERAKPLGPTSGPMVGGAATAAPVGPKPELTRTPDHSVLWGGVPTRLSDRGSRQVFHWDGWIDVDEAHRMGITPTEVAMSIKHVRRRGSQASRRLLDDGLSENPLTDR